MRVSHLRRLAHASSQRSLTPSLPSGKRPSAGFTLLEVLVVVAIIGILFALLVPMLSRVREQSKLSECANNERRLYAASLAFAIDHDNQLPRPSKVWDGPSNPETIRMCYWPMDSVGVANLKLGAFWPYLGDTTSVRQNTVMCPSDTAERLHYGGYHDINRNFSYSFHDGMVGDVSGSSTFAGIQLRMVPHPAQKMMIFEEIGPNDSYCVDPYVKNRWDDQPSGRHGAKFVAQDGNSTTANNDYAYSGLGNFCFFDGHVEAMSPSKIFANPSYFTNLFKK